MARNSTNNVSPRRVVAGVFVFVGLFGMCFGFGNQSQALIVTGAAVMILSFSVRLFTSLRRPPRRWILGTGQVIEVSQPPAESRYGRCTMQLVVDAPGMSSDPVQVDDPRVAIGQWPEPGAELPVEVAADDPNNVRVLWKQVPSRGEGFGPPDRFAPPYDAGEPDGYGEEALFAPAAAGPPPASPAGPPTVVDFDLDRPPAGAVRLAWDADPVLDPLPPELGDGPPGAGPGPAGPGPAERPVPRPRPGPHPRPRPAAAPVPALVAAADAGADPEPPVLPEPAVPEPALAEAALAEAALAQPAAAGTAPDPVPEPALAGAAAASAGNGAARGARAPVSLVDDLVTTYPSAHPGPAGAINNVGVTVLVSDLDRSVAFYRDQLGFYDVDGGEGNTVLASGETRLVLRAAPELGKVRRRSVYLNLEVSDLDAVYAELRANGVSFTNPPRPVNRTARLEQWAATFRDPDGHGIALTQWRPHTGGPAGGSPGE